MTIFDDPCTGLPAPSDFDEFLDDTNRRHLADKRKWREGLAEAEHRIKQLEIALAAVITAIADTIDEHSFDEPVERHLARAAQALDLNLASLGLKYTSCPHGNDPALCNECRGIYDEP